MIISVQGTINDSNDSAKLVAAISTFGIIKEKEPKKTLILQLVNNTDKAVENYLIGRKLRNESLVQDASIPDLSTGMDALFMHTIGTAPSKMFGMSTTKLTKGHDQENVYDIACVSKKKSFERELLDKELASDQEEKTYLQNFIDAANKVYDLVYILLPSQNKGLCERVLDFVDVNLICIKQGRKQGINTGKDDMSGETRRDMFVVTDYCFGSSFGSKALMKEYNAKTVYGMFHNVQFNDACEEGTVLSFMEQNILSEKTDTNYSFIHNLDIIYNTIVGNKKKKMSEDKPEEDFPQYENVKLIYDWDPVTENPIISIEKRGFIKKVEIKTITLKNEKDATIQSEDFSSDENHDIPEMSELNGVETKKRKKWFSKKKKSVQENTVNNADGK